MVRIDRIYAGKGLAKQVSLAWADDFRYHDIHYPHTQDLFLLSSGMGVNYFG
jgi:hypothetical protein